MLQRAEPPPPGWHLERAGLVSVGVENRPHIEVVQQASPGDVVGEFLDRHARVDAAHIGLREHELVERHVARGLQRRDLLNGTCHVWYSETVVASHSLDLCSVTELARHSPLSSWRAPMGSP